MIRASLSHPELRSSFNLSVDTTQKILNAERDFYRLNTKEMAQYGLDHPIFIASVDIKKSALGFVSSKKQKRIEKAYRSVLKIDFNAYNEAVALNLTNKEVNGQLLKAKSKLTDNRIALDQVGQPDLKESAQLEILRDRIELLTADIEGRLLYLQLVPYKESRAFKKIEKCLLDLNAKEWEYIIPTEHLLREINKIKYFKCKRSLIEKFPEAIEKRFSFRTELLESIEHYKTLWLAKQYMKLFKADLQSAEAELQKTVFFVKDVEVRRENIHRHFIRLKVFQQNIARIPKQAAYTCSLELAEMYQWYHRCAEQIKTILTYA